MIGRILSVLFLLFAIGYFLFPIDFIPDVIPLIGWIDDIFIILTSIIGLFIGWKK